MIQPPLRVANVFINSALIAAIEGNTRTAGVHQFAHPVGAATINDVGIGVRDPK